MNETGYCTEYLCDTDNHNKKWEIDQKLVGLFTPRIQPVNQISSQKLKWFLTYFIHKLTLCYNEKNGHLKQLSHGFREFYQKLIKASVVFGIFCSQASITS